MAFWDKKLGETIQLFFRCFAHTSEENEAFEINFWSEKTSKSRNLGTFLDVTNGFENQISHSAKDDGILTFNLIFCDSSQIIFRKLRNIQEMKWKVDILLSCLH